MVRDDDSVTETGVLEALAPLGLGKVGLAARVIVAVHIADDVGGGV